MAANSPLRRTLKKILNPILNESTYRVLQCLAMAWDIWTGNWYEPELDLIPLAVKPEETALDIGANYGLYCYHLSRAVGRRGRVYAFEPIPFTYKTLKWVISLFRLRNVTVISKGCSDKSGKTTFRITVTDLGSVSAGQAHIALRNDDHEGKEKQVRWKETKNILCDVIALDEFLPDIHNLTYIKCDIEGAELLAFRGAQKIIERFHPTVLCEINPWFLTGFGLRLEELTGFFFDHGYSLYHYEVIDGVKQLREIAVEEVVEDNYVFIHPSLRPRFVSLLSSE